MGTTTKIEGAWGLSVLCVETSDDIRRIKLTAGELPCIFVMELTPRAARQLARDLLVRSIGIGDAERADAERATGRAA